MSLIDNFRVETVASITPAPIAPWNDVDLCYHAIVDMKNCLIGSGWTLVETLYASGLVFTPGWFVAYYPTIFNLLPKSGSANTAPVITITRNDQCGCIDSCPGIASIGVPQTTCGTLCRNGCWLGATCPCGHTCCTENDDCTITLDTSSPGCDASGDFCAGHFTGTFASFAGGITACVTDKYFSEPGPDGTTVRITALKAGPEWNAPYFKTEVGVGVDVGGGPSRNIFGGGYKLRSVPNPFNGTTYTVTITQTVEAAISLKFNDSIEYILNLEGGVSFGPPIYFMIANPHQFIIFDQANLNESTGFGNEGGNSILATSPWTENESLTYHVVIVGTGMLMNNTVWDTYTCASFINGHSYVSAVGGAGPMRNLQFTGVTSRNFSFSQPLLTTSGKPLLTNAWIFAPAHGTDEAQIVGKVWDAFVLSHYKGHFANATVEGNLFGQMCIQTGRPCISSMWVSVGRAVG